MYMYIIIIIIIIIITSGEYEGLNCLCSSIMTLRQTRTFSSFSTCMETEIQLTTSTCTRIYRVHHSRREAGGAPSINGCGTQ